MPLADSNSMTANARHIQASRADLNFQHDAARSTHFNALVDGQHMAPIGKPIETGHSAGKSGDC